MNQSLVSVIVPAYNCQSTIAKTIEAIQKQTYQNIEIIVVDDGSRDKSGEVIKSFSKVNYIFEENAGPATARNRGAEVAKGEFLFFTDSDCVPEMNWIEQSMNHFKENFVAAVAGSYGILNDESMLARCIHKEILYRHNHLMPQYVRAFGSYNVGIRRKVFQEVKGFDANYRRASGEDNDLSYKIISAGYKIYFEKAAIVKHVHPSLISNYLKEQYRHGFWRVKMYLDHPLMMQGDDYTFWKDSLEVLLVLIIMVAVVLVPFFSAIKLIVFFLIGILFLLQLMFAFMMIKINLEFIFYSFVMFFRVFARTFGLSTGIIHFLLKNNSKKRK